MKEPMKKIDFYVEAFEAAFWALVTRFSAISWVNDVIRAYENMRWEMSHCPMCEVELVLDPWCDRCPECDTWWLPVTN
jgi:hypothetical protein